MNGFVLNILKQLAHIIDAGARCGVNFNQVGVAALINLRARAAFAARFGGHTFFAIQTPRKDTRERRFADAACAGEEVSVM